MCTCTLRITPLRSHRQQPTAMHTTCHHLKAMKLLLEKRPWLFAWEISFFHHILSPCSQQEFRIRVALQMKASKQSPPSLSSAFFPQANDWFQSTYHFQLPLRPPAITEKKTLWVSDHAVCCWHGSFIQLVTLEKQMGNCPVKCPKRYYRRHWWKWHKLFLHHESFKCILVAPCKILNPLRKHLFFSFFLAVSGLRCCTLYLCWGMRDFSLWHAGSSSWGVQAQ